MKEEKNRYKLIYPIIYEVSKRERFFKHFFCNFYLISLNHQWVELVGERYEALCK